MTIIPSIVGKDIIDVEHKIHQVEGLVDWVHIDIVDGMFASPPSWPYTCDDIDDRAREISDIQSKVNMGLHLMVREPERMLDQWIDSPVKRILIHEEALGNIESILAVVDMSKTESGVVLKLDTPLEELKDLIERVDAVVLMSINKIGGYGAEFDPDVLNKIRAFKKLYPNKPVIVDGGINEETLPQVQEAGADHAIVGSAIFKSGNVGSAIRKLQSKC